MTAKHQKQLWVQGGPFRLRLRSFVSESISKGPRLAVVIHGDVPFNEPDYHNLFAAKVAASHRDVVAIGLLRPGYTDPQGNTSDGERGESVGDNWNLTNTKAVAEAISRLDRIWNARKVVVAAHSGGAALAANVLGLYPDLIDHALLVSAVFDVGKWREYMFKRTGEPMFEGKIETVSPI